MRNTSKWFILNKAIRPKWQPNDSTKGLILKQFILITSSGSSDKQLIWQKYVRFDKRVLVSSSNHRSSRCWHKDLSDRLTLREFDVNKEGDSSQGNFYSICSLLIEVMESRLHIHIKTCRHMHANANKHWHGLWINIFIRTQGEI